MCCIFSPALIIIAWDKIGIFGWRCDAFNKMIITGLRGCSFKAGCRFPFILFALSSSFQPRDFVSFKLKKNEQVKNGIHQSCPPKNLLQRGLIWKNSSKLSLRDFLHTVWIVKLVEEGGGLWQSYFDISYGIMWI